MSNVSAFFSWRRHVIALMREGTHRMDEDGPVLSAREVRLMDSYFVNGYSPEDFVVALTAMNEQEKVS